MTIRDLDPEPIDLGYVRLWREDLAEIVRLIREQLIPKLKDVRLELLVNDEYLIPDIDSGLPEIGPAYGVRRRLKSFTALVMPLDQGGQDLANGPSARDDNPALMKERALMTVRLSTEKSYIKVRNLEPEVEVEVGGIISKICKETDRNQRVPRWFTTIPGSKNWTQSERIFILAIILPLIVLVFIAIFVWIIFAALHRGPSNSLFVPTLVVVGCIAMAMLVGSMRVRTILYTGTRDAAPTWWQKHRSDVAINAVFSVLFFILGLLVSPLTGGSNTGSGLQQTSPRSTASKAAQATTGGQVVYDGDFAFRVNSIGCGQAEAQAVYNNSDVTGTLPAGTKECIVKLWITDDKKEPQTFFDSNQYAYDAQGRQFSADDNGTYLTGDKDDTQLNPGVSITAFIPFNIPSGDTITELKLHDSDFSDGVTVRL